jgi:hypothetical protein
MKVSQELKDAIFKMADENIKDNPHPNEPDALSILREIYGDAVRVTHKDSSSLNRGDWGSVKVIHPDFYNEWRIRHGLEFIEEDILNGRCMYFIADAYQVAHGFFEEGEALKSYDCIHYSVESEMVYNEKLRSKYVERVLSQNKVGIPLLKAPRGGSFKDCPSLGEERYYPDPIILAKDGVVIPFNGQNYRVKFDWLRMSCEDDPGWGTRNASPTLGDHILIEKTDDPETPYANEDLRAIGMTTFQAFGVGRTQQDDVAPDLNGQLPVCLFVFEAGSDFTWTIMAHLDYDGVPFVAWYEGSCT